ncbi:hypothetical protein CONCODRAFT_163399 [Conidiobolus coronatus NRRL 28638]|uniref:RNI-like protein n=1 Tax=Conidiobolus coronatus (strain ATCC 28846 / CBS 209.66 / NRRL 28638) TaxID=796925 RepID=A0A137NPG5_CONC2|nr:hypothetical protein CONCODRAFT_163399 [Conidiobolus coronatus NRRL 28638]|eukprot:KXN64624.1 hypothetical protein CONCODRAFT_163399 [Conidiobolus coronatus NRRL 28638]
MNHIKHDWNITFNLPEFTHCLDFETLKEFSLISKFTRNKSNPLLFESLLLSGFKFKDYFNFNNLDNNQTRLISDYAEYLENHWEAFENEDKCSKISSNNSELDILTRELSNTISKISKFSSSMRIFSFSHTFYALYPFIYNLSNLIHLQIASCTVPLVAILNIGKHFKNLKSLKLGHVDIIQLTKQEINISSIDLPDNLEELELIKCSVQLWNSRPKISKLIRTLTSTESSSPSNLLAFKFKNLKKLNLREINDSYIERMLALNPNVEDLTIDEESARQEDFQKISTMEWLTKLTLLNVESNDLIIKSFESDIEIPKFNFITILKLEFIHYINFDLNEYHNILVYFPNLSELCLDLTYFDFSQSNINLLLSTNLLSCNTLDILALCSDERDNDGDEDYWGDYEYNFDWSVFTNVKCLYLELKSLKVEDIDFNALPPSLKEIRFKCSDIEGELKWIGENIGNLFIGVLVLVVMLFVLQNKPNLLI